MKTSFARIAGLFILLTACDSIETFPASDAGGSDASTSTDTSTSVDAAPSPCAGKDCDDKSDCTTDKCDEVTGKCINDKQPDGVLCSDGNLCTEGDMCADGKCAGTAKDCEDGDKCTINGCDSKTGKCASQEKTGCVPDEPCKDSDCDDNNACTDDFCNAAGQCVHVNDDGNTCVDGNKCTTSDACKAGICVGATKVCNDNSPCTTDACDPKTGECVYTPVSNQWKEPCNDSSDATVNDTCVDGKCIGEIPSPKCVAANCDDGNKCTTDYCSAGGQCAHATTSADGMICAPATNTADFKCQSGTCQAFPKPTPCSPEICNDGNPCTLDYCGATNKCISSAVVMENNSCGQGSSTYDLKCLSGVCTPVLKPVNPPKCVDSQCADDNPCTTDYCDTAGTCVHAPGPNEGSACGVATAIEEYKCQGGICKAWPKPQCMVNSQCNDNNACTDDNCIGGKCSFAPLSGCQTCSSSLGCNDGNECTYDVCSNGKCSYPVVSNGVSCNNSNMCKPNDACYSGVCKAGNTVFCNDNNSCTTDSCNPSTGCVFTAIPGCGLDPCAGKNCFDGNGCTLDLCEAGACKYVPETGKTCNDNNACTINDACTAGAFCSGTPKSCDDGNVCTADSCNASGQCINTTIVGCGVDPVIKIEMKCEQNCEVHAFFGNDSQSKYGVATGGAWFTVEEPKSLMCKWGAEIAARVHKDINPVMPWYGCDSGAPSLSKVTVRINGQVVQLPYVKHPWVCGGVGEGNLQVTKAMLGCP